MMFTRILAFFQRIGFPLFESPQEVRQRRLSDMLEVVDYTALMKTDPQNITIEDVARIMDIDEEHAKSILDACVVEGSHELNDDGTYRLVDIDARIAALDDAAARVCATCGGNGLRRVGETFVDSPCSICEGSGRS